MDNPAWNDTQLVRASQQGNQQAFAALVHRYKGLVSGLAYSSTCDPVLSQDLAQEAFTVAWRKLDRITDAEKFRPWICGILRHLVQQALRERQREAVPATGEAKDKPSTSPSPREEAVAREQSETVARALARLPEEYRLPLVLYYYEGRSSRLVAEALGITDDAVRQRLVRGRERLREELLNMVDDTLDRQRPKQAFVVAVLAGLSKAPAATVTATKAAFSAATAKSVAATAGIVVTVSVVLFALLPTSVDSVAESPPLSPATVASAKSQASGEPPAPAEAMVPAVAEVETPPTPSPPPPSSADADDMALAASILDRGWETWKSQTQFYDATRCVNAWGYRASLGDEQCRARLIREATDPDSGKYGPRSNQILISTLGDMEYLNGLFERCANANISQYDRMGHFASLYFCIEFLQARKVTFPDAVIGAAVTVAETVGPHKTMMDFLEKTATERARPMAEYYLLASLQDGAATPLSGEGFTSFGSLDGADLNYGGHCLASCCLDILERIANPASREVLREYLPQAGPLDAAHAASVLCRLGDREYGVGVLKEVLARVEDPLVRSGCLTALVNAGERGYIDAIRQDALSGDPFLRLQAFCTLCSLNDKWFIEPAVQDFVQYQENGFWQILESCPVNSQPTPSGVRNFRNTACVEYCLALANQPDAIRAEEKSGAMMELLALTALKDSPEASRAVAACMPALMSPGPPEDIYPARSLWCTRLVFLLHWGDPETRQRAADCLTHSYRQDPDIARWVARELVNATNPEALPLLVEIMKTQPYEALRMTAAEAYFAIKSGKRW